MGTRGGYAGTYGYPRVRITRYVMSINLLWVDGYLWVLSTNEAENGFMQLIEVNYMLSVIFSLNMSSCHRFLNHGKDS
jgi:hypothetical protein